jgi:hypothetical protein
MIRKLLKLNEIDYYKTHLIIINSVLPVKLTSKEIELLAHFMILKGSISLDRFGTTGKKIVKQKMKLSSASMSNYMKSLSNKGFIINGKIIPILFPSDNEEEYYFKLINDRKE